MIESGRIDAAKNSVAQASSVMQSAVTTSASGVLEAMPASFSMVGAATESLSQAINLVCGVLSEVVREINKLAPSPGAPDLNSAIAKLTADVAKLAPPERPEKPDMDEREEPKSDINKVRIDNIKSDMDELRAEIDKFDGFRSDVEQAVTTLHSEMEALRNQFRVDMEALRSQSGGS